MIPAIDLWSTPSLFTAVMAMPKILQNVGIYRDSGSISVSCECPDLFCNCTLLLEIDVDSSEWESVRKFQGARLEEFHSFDWTSKITGAVYNDTFHCESRVCWETAREILSELLPQAMGLTSDDLRIWEEMILVANSVGTGLPIDQTDGNRDEL